MTVRGPDGTESPTGGEFREIDPPERLVFTTTAFDGPDDPAEHGMVIEVFSGTEGATSITQK